MFCFDFTISSKYIVLFHFESANIWVKFPRKKNRHLSSSMYCIKWFTLPPSNKGEQEIFRDVKGCNSKWWKSELVRYGLEQGKRSVIERTSKQNSFWVLLVWSNLFKIPRLLNYMCIIKCRIYQIYNVWFIKHNLCNDILLSFWTS